MALPRRWTTYALALTPLLLIPVLMGIGWYATGSYEREDVKLAKQIASLPGVESVDNSSVELAPTVTREQIEAVSTALAPRPYWQLRLGEVVVNDGGEVSANEIAGLLFLHAAELPGAKLVDLAGEESLSVRVETETASDALGSAAQLLASVASAADPGPFQYVGITAADGSSITLSQQVWSRPAGVVADLKRLAASAQRNPTLTFDVSVGYPAVSVSVHAPDGTAQDLAVTWRQVAAGLPRNSTTKLSVRVPEGPGGVSGPIGSDPGPAVRQGDALRRAGATGFPSIGTDLSEASVSLARPGDFRAVVNASFAPDLRLRIEMPTSYVVPAYADRDELVLTDFVTGTADELRRVEEPLAAIRRLGYAVIWGMREEQRYLLVSRVAGPQRTVQYSDTIGEFDPDLVRAIRAIGWVGEIEVNIDTGNGGSFACADPQVRNRFRSTRSGPASRIELVVPSDCALPDAVEGRARQRLKESWDGIGSGSGGN